jgi:hypothetical protein
MHLQVPLHTAAILGSPAVAIQMSLTKTLCSQWRMSLLMSFALTRSRRYRAEVQTRRRQSDSSINSSWVGAEMHS